MKLHTSYEPALDSDAYYLACLWLNHWFWHKLTAHTIPCIAPGEI